MMTTICVTSRDKEMGSYQLYRLRYSLSTGYMVSLMLPSNATLIVAPSSFTRHASDD